MLWYIEESTAEAQETDEYKAFVNKFEPKKTTDDCYTPEIVHEAVMAWVEKRYGLDRRHFVRPFWPGADYTRYPYKPDDVVVDNPPFSILRKICTWYQAHGVSFFLYAPGVTVLNTSRDFTAVCTGCTITYENGAEVNTSFITNMEGDVAAMTAPDLNDAVEDTVAEWLSERRVHVPKYRYPANVVTASMMNYMAEKAAAEKAAAEKATAEKATAIEWTISEREREIIRQLDVKNMGG